MTRSGPAWPRITVGQMMKIVLISAVGFAAATPFTIPWRMGVAKTPAVVVAAAFVAPLAMALVSVLVLRPGPWKDRLILVELLFPVTIGLILAVVFAYWTLWATVWPPWSQCLGFALVIPLFFAAFVFLVTRLVRQFRPRCETQPIDV